MFKKILVPIDGSKSAHKALEKSLYIAKNNDAEITILHVVERHPIPLPARVYPYFHYPIPWLMGHPNYRANAHSFSYPEWGMQYYSELFNHTENFFKEIVKQTKTKFPDIEIKSLLDNGKTAEKILDISEEGDYDLIVMGSTGLGDIGRFFLVE
jgi:nucleotide-binding universal stress UspA family protein